MKTYQVGDRLAKIAKMGPMARLLYWIREREDIRQQKEAGAPKPWTVDPILRAYRFCNVCRADDKVSRWLLENWYGPYHGHRNMLVACALARFFNLPSSLEAISHCVFRPEAPDWARMRTILRQMKKQGTIFNAAYMVRGNDGKDKVASVINHCVKPLYTNPPEVYRNSMERTHAELVHRYGFGSFMAGQVVADLRYAMPGDWADRKSWAPIGPGSRRGMNRLMGQDLYAPLDQDQFEDELLMLIDRGSKRIDFDLADRMEAIDWQNVLCETDKYTRVLLGEGRPKQLYPGME